jgi:hypothetical protein
MKLHGFAKECEPLVIQRKALASQLSCEFDRSSTMIGVVTITVTTTVVEEGKQFNHIRSRTPHLGELQSDFSHPCPMAHAVDSRPREAILCPDGVDQPL